MLAAMIVSIGAITCPPQVGLSSRPRRTNERNIEARPAQDEGPVALLPADKLDAFIMAGSEESVS